MPEDGKKSYDWLTLTLAKQFEMPPDEFRKAIISQAFPGGAATDYQLTQFLMVAYNRKLNPFEKGEIYAFVNKVGVLTIGTGRDGWTKIAHRNPHFRGYKYAEVIGKDGEFLGIHMEMHRDDWSFPGEYTAYLEEWNKQVLNAAGWKNQPRHLTFVKAWQECTKATFAVTDIATDDEMEEIKQADAEGRTIYQPAGECGKDVIRGVTRCDQPVNHAGPCCNSVYEVAHPAPDEPRGIEYRPAEQAPFLNAMGPDQREAVRVHENPAQPTGHLRVKVDLPTGPQESGGAPATATGGEVLARHPSSPSPAPTSMAAESGTEALSPDPAPAAQGVRRGLPAGSKNKPRLEPDPLALADGAIAAETQRAAGLEVLDPGESALETFIRSHDLEQRRVDATLAKFGADKVGDLSAEDAATVLRIFQNSVAAMAAARE